LDTSVIIDFLRGEEKTRSIVASAERMGESVAATTVSLFELLSPIYHRRLRREEKVLRAFGRQAMLLSLDFHGAEEAAKIMGSLLRLGRPINALDVLICGIAISNNADQILTSDRDFEEIGKVASIKIELIR